MNFWETSDNEEIESNKEFDAGGGDFDPIPAKTNVLAVVDKSEWQQNDFNGDYINIQWSVLAPEEYKNRKVFQNIKVMDDDDKKADKAKAMLAAIDANAGGKLLASGKRPDDNMLTKALTGKQMMLMLQVWKMDGDDGQERTGNWVSAVAPKQRKKPAPQVDDYSDDDIEF